MRTRQVDADAFVMRTDTVYEGWGTPRQRAIAAGTAGTLVRAAEPAIRYRV